MDYSIKQASEMSGVSVRTLRLYDEMGLVRPKRRANGYRAYSSADLNTLQQVLLYKACGMELSVIARILKDSEFDERKALEEHLEGLYSRKQQLEASIETLKKTIGTLEGKCTMTDEEKFAGLKQAAISKNEEKHGDEARRRWGDEMVDEANRRISAMNKREWDRKEQLEQQIIEILAHALPEGNLNDETAKELSSAHAEWICMQWGEAQYSKEAHKSLAAMYTEDARFSDYYDSRAGTGAAELLARTIIESI